MKTRSFLLLTIRRRSYERTLSLLPSISGPALVLGASPTAGKPKSYEPGWFVVTVNGSQIVGEALGVGTPDLTIMRDGIAAPGLHSDAVWKALKGRQTRHLISNIASRGDKGLAGRLPQYGYSADKITEISRYVRGAVIAEMLNRYQVSLTSRESISNGFFAALLAARLGANPVIMAGFSFSRTGLYFDPTKHFNREHLSGDAMACEAIVKRRLPIFTEDEDFARESGLRLWPSAQA